MRRSGAASLATAIAKAQMEDRRLMVLQVLEETGSSNDSVLESVLSVVGHLVTRDMLLTELAWLEEQGLVTTTVVSPKLTVASITERGVDVALGRARQPGVKRALAR